MAARRWAHIWKNKHVVVYSDNSAIVAMINKGSSKNSTAMSWLRCLFWKSQDNNWLIGVYKRILEKHILEKPYLIDFIDRLFNPILGKSLSIYFEKK